MRALVHDRPSVVLAEVPAPDPTAERVLVRVEAVSVNRGETFQLAGADRPGWRPGKDLAGVVDTSSDERFPVGARVVAHVESGAWGELALVPPDRLATLPEGVSSEAGAALPLAGLTALRILRRVGDVASRSILLTGASGGVGHYLTEMAVARGATVTAVSRRGAGLVERGATVIEDVTAAEGTFDIGLDSVGGRSLSEVVSHLPETGTAVWFGQASGEPVSISFFDLFTGPINGRIEVFGYESAAGRFDDDLATLVDLTSHGVIRPVLDVRDWTDAPAAITDLVERRVTGNLVLRVGR